MSAQSDTGVPNTPGIPADPETPAELRERIEHTRQELGDTIEELAARADVKALAQRKASDAVRAGRRNVKPLVTAGGAVLAAVVAVLVLRQRKQRRRYDRYEPRLPDSVRRLAERMAR